MKSKIIQGFAAAFSIVIAIASTTVFAKEDTNIDDIDEKTVTKQEVLDDNFADSDDVIISEENNVKSETVSEDETKEDADKEINEADLEDEEDKELEDIELEDEEDKKDKDEKIEILNQKLTGKVADCKISIEGDFPENAKLSLKETGSPQAVISQIEKNIDSAYGYFEVASFDIQMTYEEDGKTKDFSPFDYNDSCVLTVTESDRPESLSAFSLEDSRKLDETQKGFIITDDEPITVGVKYKFDTSICGKAPKDVANATVYATGDGVTYSTKSNRNGWYLFTDVDYSNAYLGCSFQITTDN